jgi:hypothetical protein
MNKSETRGCQNCKNDFTIESDDFSFYEKIKVPPPTFCPHCRFVRRMIWRNERSLYKRACDMCKKNIISMYDDGVSFPVYCPECYKSDNWGAETYAKDYDFNKSFIEQWKELFYKIPTQSLCHTRVCINSEYANYVADSKNVYMSFSVIDNSEDISHAINIDNSKQIVDSYNVSNSELLYENIGTNKNYSCQYSYWSSNCISSTFILNCNNCQDCFGCINLNNKRHCIYNKQYTKEQYEDKMKEFDIGSYFFIKNFKKEFWNFSLSFPRKYANIINSIDSTGDDLRNNKNTLFCFNVYNSEDIKYGYRSLGCKDSMDVGHCIAEVAYEHVTRGSENSQNINFIINGGEALRDASYCDYCYSSSNLFGCIGLRNKQYCILNKQYEKEEYFEMVEKIKKHMDDMPYIDKKGRVYKYGEFFPFELCPFGYNEAVINDHFPLSKEEIIEKGYPYKEKIDNVYTVTLKARDIPDNIKDVDDSILKEVIECEKSGRAFKITPFELQFYRRMNIPIPRLHPDERYKERLALRNPMILYHRSCMKGGRSDSLGAEDSGRMSESPQTRMSCSNEFETSYSPERPEIIYCEQCYQQEIY